jgi:hypothetical protein
MAVARLLVEAGAARDLADRQGGHAARPRPGARLRRPGADPGGRAPALTAQTRRASVGSNPR